MTHSEGSEVGRGGSGGSLQGGERVGRALVGEERRGDGPLMLVVGEV